MSMTSWGVGLINDFGRDIGESVMRHLGTGATEEQARAAAAQLAKKRAADAAAQTAFEASRDATMANVAKRARAAATPARAPAAPARKPKPTPAPPSFAVAPAIVGKASPGAHIIATRQAELDLPNKKRLQPTGANPAFETTPEAYARTTDIVPQSTREEVLARIPFLPEGDRDYPQNGRVLPFIDRQEEIGQALAEKTKHLLGTNPEHFYHTGPVLEGLDRAGVDPAWLRDTFAPLYAGTSPQTNTVQNLLNASIINHMRAQGMPIPLDKEAFAKLGNIGGYGMIGSNYSLADRLINKTHDPMVNPKPSEFMPNVAGDLSGVTGDTHHIRGLVQTFNELYPGELPEEWLYKTARERYRDTGTFNPALDVNDSLASASRGGRKKLVEYGGMALPTLRAADVNKISGGPQQALQWFGFGKDTGLASPSKTFTELLNDHLDTTGQALGVSPEETLKMLVKGDIPMLADGGPVRRGEYAVDIGRRR